MLSGRLCCLLLAEIRMQSQTEALFFWMCKGGQAFFRNSLIIMNILCYKKIVNTWINKEEV
jgi:hypothetical protein